MSLLNITSILVGIAIFAVLIIGLAMTRFYKRATMEVAFVRTGMGGDKVVHSGGAIVWPYFQGYTPVNMKTMKLIVDRRGHNSLYTKDLLRADAIIEFYVRVGRVEELIKLAASLGDMTNDPNALSQLIEGKLVGAIRSVAARMEMEELHQQRDAFNSEVRDAVSTELAKNGLELESVMLTNLTQTPKDFFDPDNIMDAEGLTKLTEITENRRKSRSEIENETRILIQRDTVDADKNALEISKDGELAAITQQKEIEEERARTESLILITKIEEERKSKEAEIAREKAIRQAEIERDRDLEIAQQERSISIAIKSEEEEAARAKAELARSESVKATEKVETSRLTEIATREKSVAVIAAEKKAEEESVGILVKASAEKDAAADKAEAIKLAAEAEVYRISKLAEANKSQALAEAEGLLAKNEAENSLSPAAMALRQRLATIEHLADIIKETVKPLENIESIRILDAGGLIGSGNSSELSQGIGGVDSIVNAALKYSTHKPILEDMLNGIGLGNSLNDIVTKAGGITEDMTPVDDKTTTVTDKSPRTQVPAAEPVGSF